jgi:hypothetical protein
VARKKDPVEVDLAAYVKTARTSIRLKHSLAADAEIAEVVPKLEAKFYAAIQAGRKPKLGEYSL